MPGRRLITVADGSSAPLSVSPLPYPRTRPPRICVDCGHVRLRTNGSATDSIFLKLSVNVFYCATYCIQAPSTLKCYGTVILTVRTDPGVGGWIRHKPSHQPDSVLEFFSFFLFRHSFFKKHFVFVFIHLPHQVQLQ